MPEHGNWLNMVEIEIGIVGLSKSYPTIQRER